MNSVYFNEHNPQANSSIEPRSHRSLFSVRSRGKDDGVTIRWWGGSIAISIKFWLFLVFFISLPIYFLFFMYETCLATAIHFSRGN